MKRIALCAGLLFLGSVLGGGSVYGYSKYVQATQSTYISVINGKTSTGQMLLYNNVAYIQVGGLLQQLSQTGTPASWKSGTLSFNPDPQSVNFVSYVNAVNKMLSAEITAENADIANTNQPTSSNLQQAQADVQKQIPVIQNEILTVSDWRVHSTLDEDIKLTWIDLLNNDLMGLYVLSNEFNTEINGMTYQNVPGVTTVPTTQTNTSMTSSNGQMPAAEQAQIQSEIAAENARLAADMNKRGTYNSGLLQQEEQQQDAIITQQVEAQWNSLNSASSTPSSTSTSTIVTTYTSVATMPNVSQLVNLYNGFLPQEQLDDTKLLSDYKLEGWTSS